jgi:hypothetical protein
MRNIVAWIVALSVVVMLGGAALAGGDGACSYGSYPAQQVQEKEKADAAKTVATAAPDKTEAEKLLLMQGDKVAKTVATPKK